MWSFRPGPGRKNRESQEHAWFLDRPLTPSHAMWAHCVEAAETMPHGTLQPMFSAAPPTYVLQDQLQTPSQRLANLDFMQRRPRRSGILSQRFRHQNPLRCYESFLGNLDCRLKCNSSVIKISNVNSRIFWLGERC